VPGHAPQQRLGVGDRQRLAEQVALRRLALLFLQVQHLVEGLDALGHDVDAERARHLDDGAGDRAVAHPGLEVADERAVDLEAVDGEVAQPAEARIADAEVVDGERNPDVAQRGQHFFRPGLVAHDHRLRDLEFDVLRFDAGVLQGARHHLGEVAPQELHARDVHRDVLEGQALVAPAACLGAGGAQHPVTDRHDQSRFLGDVDQLQHRHGAELRVVPAQQRLESGEFAGRELELRLVMQAQLVAVQGAAQLALDRHAAQRAVAHRGLEERVAAVGAALGEVHRQIGVVQQGGRIPAISGAECHADARRHDDLVLADPHGRAQCLDDALGQRGGRLA